MRKISGYNRLPIFFAACHGKELLGSKNFVFDEKLTKMTKPGGRDENIDF